MAIDDVATRPERIAAEIHHQLGDVPPPIPIYDIARALDIDEIREEPIRNFEGVLLTEDERDFGTILINRSSPPQRRKYSLGHELGHFLCTWHRPTEGDSFQCTRFDMADPAGNAIHVRQEREANRFAIELLAPERLVRPHLRRLPELEDVLALRSRLDISKAAAARRYVSLHRERLAVVFAKSNTFEYAVRGENFPWLSFQRGDRLPALPRVGRDAQTSEMVEADPEDWLRSTRAAELGIQILRQEDYRSIILLHLANGVDGHGES